MKLLSFLLLLIVSAQSVLAQHDRHHRGVRPHHGGGHHRGHHGGYHGGQGHRGPRHYQAPRHHEAPRHHVAPRVHHAPRHYVAPRVHHAPRNYQAYSHRVHRPHAHSHGWNSPTRWYNHVYQNNRNYIRHNRIFWPAPAGYSNGYYMMNSYPYYVHNGYQYRYSSVDYCNYQLVDSANNYVIQSYFNEVCNTGYDSCSVQRDQLNMQEQSNRYYCSESYSN